ncbi:MAG: hypothetical protein IKT03_01135 [Muribaculaceae bacterium]|nr:hypothetical protein [Muribaculaceae bacterium]MBR6489117.1 hypothetical protein [Muribaculaceae bacterium]
MKPIDCIFTIEEVEKLCQLYLDCQMSILEETELEYVLMHFDFCTPLIDETKKLMMVSHSVKFDKKQRKRSTFLGWSMSAAACLAMILGTIAFYRQSAKNNLNGFSDDFCIVYVSGKRASHDDAQKIAEADVAKMQQFMLIINEKQNQEETKVEHFMNQINQ